ncbi:hypothetical protein [Paraburkholderia sp. HD33-4]|uniref:hypothetical protein n=1 Tax=Paraburkholderia sp. HD33-4 TaxID=2883242 RepID=UPI001F45EB39|nr:hypothetical protein [Paraburkholderia sp. HD33-4]
MNASANGDAAVFAGRCERSTFRRIADCTVSWLDADRTVTSLKTQLLNILVHLLLQ